MNIARHAAVALSLFTVAACTTNDTTNEAAPLPCAPGQANACGCSDGRTGSQVCADDGESYAACVCMGPSPSASSGATTSTTQASTGANAGGATTSTASTTSGASTGGFGGASSSEAASSSHASSSHTGVTNGPSVASSASSAASGGGGFGGAGGGDIGGGSSTGAGGSPLDGPWARTFGAVQNTTTVTAMATDSQGNVALTGIYGGSMTLGGHTFTCDVIHTTAQCGWVAELDPSGNVRWARAFQGGGIASTLLAIGPSDEVVVAGTFSGVIDFGFGQVYGPSSVFVSTYTSSGAPQWGVHFDPPLQRYGGTFAGLAVDTSGRIGFTTLGGYVDCGDGNGGPQIGGVQIAVLENNGVLAWEKTFASYNPGTVLFNALSTTSLGDWVWVGSYTQDVDFGCGVASAESANAVVLDFDASGSCRRSHLLGYTTSTALVVDPTDDGVVLAGSFGGSLDAGSSMLTSMGQFDLFVVRLDSNLDPIWGRTFGSGADGLLASVGVHPSTGEIAVGGQLVGSADFGEGPRAPPGAALFATFTEAGAPIESGNFGDSHFGQTSSVTFDPSGDLFIAGTMGGTMNFGNGVVIQSAGQMDAFVAKLGEL